MPISLNYLFLIVVLLAPVLFLLGFVWAGLKSGRAKEQWAQAMNQLDLSKSRLEEQLKAEQNSRQLLQEQTAVLSQRLDDAQNTLIAMRDQLSTAVANEQALSQQLVEQKRLAQQAQQQQQETAEKYHQSQVQYSQLKTSLSEKEKAFDEKLQQLEQNKQLLSKEFESLANRIFEEKGKRLSENNQADLNQLLRPFKEQIEAFQKRVTDIHETSIKNHSSLKTEIDNVSRISKNLSEEANNLSKALKGDAQKRGAWGEAQLRRTLEISGLVEGEHYSYQDSFDDEDGKRKRTDFLIRLPDGKHIIIDSKVTLNAYDETVAAETPEQYQLAMKKHVAAVRQHVDDLASKHYTHLSAINSPDFALLFMPIESAYVEALKNDAGLFEYAYNKNVVLVSHTTLMPILRTVSNLWMLEKGNRQAREITDKAGDIYNQVCVVAERLGKLGASLSAVGGHYNQTVTALVGQQGLYNKVQRFSELSTKANKSFKALEAMDLGVDSQRLQVLSKKETDSSD